MSKKKKLAPPPAAPVTNLEQARAWASAREITEIECLVPDLAGVARGKIMPASKFFDDPVMALPSSIFMQTISGEYPEETAEFRYDPSDGDLELRPDFSTLCQVPWAHDPTAQVIHDAHFHDGRAVEIAPRQVLKRVIGLYRDEGWEPIVAPEIEFYLVKRNTDPDYPLEPPIGRSGRAEAGRRSYSISAVNEFDAVFEDIYAFAEAQQLEVDTLIHEEGAAQMEINLRHGDPLLLADQVFLLKRTIREDALAHDIYPSVGDLGQGRRQHLHRRQGKAHGGLLPLPRRPAALPAGRHLHAGALRQLLSPAGEERLGPGQCPVGL